MSFESGDEVPPEAIGVLLRPSSTFSKTSDTTLEAVPGMSFDVEAGAAYKGELLLAYTGADAGGGKVDWDFVGAHEFRRWVVALPAGATNNTDSNVQMPRRDGPTDQSFGVGSGSGTGSTGYIEHFLIVADSDDTITLRFAQDASSSTASVVSTASAIIVRRIA